MIKPTIFENKIEVNFLYIFLTTCANKHILDKEQEHTQLE